MVEVVVHSQELLEAMHLSMYHEFYDGFILVSLLRLSLYMLLMQSQPNACSPSKVQ